MRLHACFISFQLSKGFCEIYGYNNEFLKAFGLKVKT